MMMGSLLIYVATWSKDYQTPKKQTVEKEAIDTPYTFAPPSSDPIHIERPNNEFVI